MQQYHQREISRDCCTNKIHADVNNAVFKTYEKWTERGLNTAALYYSAKSAFNLIKQDFSRQLQSLKQFSSKPQLDLLSGRNLYSGIDVERIIDDVKSFAKNNNSTNLMGNKNLQLKNASFQSFSRNKSQRINGITYSGHAIDKMQNSGIMPSVVENTLNFGQSVRGKKINTLRYYDNENNISLIVNSKTKKLLQFLMGS